MIPAVAYARVSTEAQADNITPIASQLSEIHKWAESNGYVIIREYIDEARRGSDDFREEFVRMKSEAENGKADFEAVIVWKFDRIARKVETASLFRAILKRQGIKLLSITEPNVEGPMAILINSFLDAMAELYSLQLAENTLRGQKENARMGYTSGGIPPYGLRAVKKKMETGKEKTAWEPDPETAPVLRKIYEMSAAGDGYMTITKHLNELGIPAPKGGKWAKHTLHYLLFRNQSAYLGKYIFNREDNDRIGHKYKPEEEWIVVENAWEPIITQELADAVMRRKQTKTKAKPTASRAPFLLTGLVFCGECGSAMVGCASGRKETWSYYRCNGASSKGGVVCNALRVRRDLLESSVLENIKQNFFSIEVLRDMETSVLSNQVGDKAKLKAELRRVKSNMIDLEKRRDNIYAAIESGNVEMRHLSERLDEINIGLTLSASELKKIQTQIDTKIKKSSDAQLLEFRDEIINIFSGDGANGLSKSISSIVKRIDVYQRESEIEVKIEYYWKPPQPPSDYGKDKSSFQGFESSVLRQYII